MIDGVGPSLDRIAQPVVVARIVGIELRRGERAERQSVDPARDLHAQHNRVSRSPVSLRNRGSMRGGPDRIAASRPNNSTAPWPQHARVQAVAGREMALRKVVVDEPDHEVQLGSRQRRVGLDAAAGLGKVGRGRPLRSRLPAPDLGWKPRRATRRPEAEQVRASRPVEKRKIQVILQVVPDTRQLVDDADAVAGAFVRRTDTRQQQQLRRLEGAGR